MKFIITLLLSLFTLNAFCVSSDKCSTMLNNGLWRKYQYAGVGESRMNATTRGTKKEGSSTATSDSTTEQTTTAVDPKYTSNVATSQTQSSSSWGECDIFAARENLKQDRERYIAQNETEVLIDVARGAGEHLKVITFYSACMPEAYTEISSGLQKSLAEFKNFPNSKSICIQIDKIISENENLKLKCASSL